MPLPGLPAVQNGYQGSTAEQVRLGESAEVDQAVAPSTLSQQFRADVPPAAYNETANSHRFVAGFSRADAYRVCQLGDENFSVADLPRLGRFDNRVDHRLGLI